MNVNLNNLKKSLQQGDLQNSITQLLEITQNYPKRFHNEVILHGANFRQLRDNERKGLVSNEEIRREKSRLLNALLDLIDELEETFNRQNSIASKSNIESQNQQLKILILAANPQDTSSLRLGEQIREIKEGLRRSKQRDKFSIATAQAVRYRDIHRAILDHEPNILHFSGHGAGEEGLIFEDQTGKSKLVSSEALAGLFSLFSEQLECVVLNACYSKYQAQEIVRHINFVVGMSREIKDAAAIEFAIGFYDALGAGKDYKFAYELGCSAILTAGLPDNLTPQFLQQKS